MFPRFVTYYSNVWAPSPITGLQGADFIDILHWGGLA